MRRRDKLANIARINKRMNESAFNWNGVYENEDDIHEEVEGVEEGTMSLGDDIEVVDEEITNITTDVSNETQFFSDEDEIGRAHV